MANRIAAIHASLQEFIQQQHVFFVGTAAADGRVNVSPKGMDSLRVLTPNRVIWLNVTGSGNETAAHISELNRMTIMFCAVAGKPLILRLYGEARAVHPADAGWEELQAHFPPLPGARQIFDVQIDLVQTSCGMAVPYMEYEGERDALNQWADRLGESGIASYWQEKNTKSLDGKPIEI